MALASLAPPALSPPPGRRRSRSSLPPPMAKFQDVSKPFMGQQSYSIKLVSFRRKIDSGTMPLLHIFSRNTGIRWGGVCSAADSNEIATKSSDADSSGVTESAAEDQLPPSDANSDAIDLNKNNTPSTTTLKRARLTAREKLRAARVLSRYTDSKPSKSSGSKILDAMRESDKGKKNAGLPEAPVDLFDDGKRGMPKPGWTFDFPGGSDLLIIAFSFVFISTVMFATTYIVWKVGAIHFNEY